MVNYKKNTKILNVDNEFYKMLENQKCLYAKQTGHKLSYPQLTKLLSQGKIKFPKINLNKIWRIK